MNPATKSIVGTIPQGIIAHKNGDLTITDIVNGSRRDLTRKATTRRKSLKLHEDSIRLNKKECIHASFQYLDKISQIDSKYSSNIHLPGLGIGSNNQTPRFSLMVIVWKEVVATVEYHSASVSLLVESGGVHGEETQLMKLTELKLVNKFERKFHAHLLPPHKRPKEDAEEKVHSFKNRIVILNLEENVIQFSVEVFPHEDASQARIVLLDSEMISRCFWWAQWVPQYNFLALAIDRKIQQSTFDEEETPRIIVKQMLTVLQFHSDFPRESVLNMPLDVDTADALATAKLIPNPNILSSKPVNLKICAHASGAIYLFSVKNCSNETASSTGTGSIPLKYSANLLHHNKTLTVETQLSRKDAAALKIDISTFANDQYLVVFGWPAFVHLLDVGVTHEPSHHITLTLDNFLSLAPFPPSDSTFTFLVPTDNPEDKQTTFTITYANDNLALNQIPLAAAKFHQLLEKTQIPTKLKLSIIHYILVHVGDINVCKRIIYDEGKRLGNLNLTKIYQEFIVGAAYAQTKKQLLPNMEPFLSLIPYCPHSPTEYNGHIDNMSIELCTNWTEVCTMLLSPSQRVFPHNVTDVWTSLWHMNKQLSKSSRFSHKNVADKLLLALQCYKPEALSKASTPMSPSSPMVCASLGDIAGLFGRRTTELQLPFQEHESCTANKQEYIFSINLRELSMHLLKERKEYPLLGHTVAGKYVCALVDTARLLCHLSCLTVHLQPTKSRDKGFRLIDCLEWETKLRLFMLLEHYALALGKLACPLPQGFTPFFAYLAYKTLNFDQFIWHVRAGTFELQIDLVKTIMTDLKDSDDVSVSRKLQLLSLLPKSRAYRILNSWSHPVSVTLRARQHSSDLLSGTVSQARKSGFVSLRKKKVGDAATGKTNITALDSFFQLLTGKANANDIDLGLLTEATMLSMEQRE